MYQYLNRCKISTLFVFSMLHFQMLSDIFASFKTYLYHMFYRYTFVSKIPLYIWLDNEYSWWRTTVILIAANKNHQLFVWVRLYLCHNWRQQKSLDIKEIYHFHLLIFIQKHTLSLFKLTDIHKHQPYQSLHIYMTHIPSKNFRNYWLPFQSL